MGEKNISNRKLSIGVLLGVIAIILLVLGTIYSMKLNNEQEVVAEVDSSTEKEFVKLSGNTEGLTSKQIKLIENNIIPQASDFFQYEEVRVYNDRRAGYVLSFVVSNESFGVTYGEFYEPTLTHKESDAIEMIHEQIRLASLKLDSIINQTDGVIMEFKLPNMENRLIMKVRSGDVIKTVFEEE